MPTHTLLQVMPSIMWGSAKRLLKFMKRVWRSSLTVSACGWKRAIWHIWWRTTMSLWDVMNMPLMLIRITTRRIIVLPTYMLCQPTLFGLWCMLRITNCTRANMSDWWKWGNSSMICIAKMWLAKMANGRWLSLKKWICRLMLRLIVICLTMDFFIIRIRLCLMRVVSQVIHSHLLMWRGCIANMWR